MNINNLKRICLSHNLLFHYMSIHMIKNAIYFMHHCTHQVFKFYATLFIFINDIFD